MVKKTIYSGSAVGFYVDSSRLSKMVEEEGGNYVHHDLSSSRKYDPFNENIILYHIKGVTLTYKDNGRKKRTAEVQVYGSIEEIAEVEKIIAKNEQQYELPVKGTESSQDSPSSTVDAATLVRWSIQARKWGNELREERRKLRPGRSLPPGFDPDDEHHYSFRIPR